MNDYKNDNKQGTVRKCPNGKRNVERSRNGSGDIKRGVFEHRGGYQKVIRRTGGKTGGNGNG